MKSKEVFKQKAARIAELESKVNDEDLEDDFVKSYMEEIKNIIQDLTFEDLMLLNDEIVDLLEKN